MTLRSENASFCVQKRGQIKLIEHTKVYNLFKFYAFQTTNPHKISIGYCYRSKLSIKSVDIFSLKILILNLLHANFNFVSPYSVRTRMSIESIPYQSMGDICAA